MPARSLGPAGRAVALGLAVAAPASALLVGCGGPSESERYGDAFSEVARPLTAALIDLGNAVGSASSRKQVSAALGRTGAALETARDGFAALDPPADAAAAQADLLAALDRFDREIDVTRDALRDGSDRVVVRALKDFDSESRSFATQLGEIGQRLEEAGIPLDAAPTAGSP